MLGTSPKREEIRQRLEAHGLIYHAPNLPAMESCKNNFRVSTTPDRSGYESARIKFGKTCQVWREDSGTCFYMSPCQSLIHVKWEILNKNLLKFSSKIHGDHRDKLCGLRG
jgi:hypothetical protein